MKKKNQFYIPHLVTISLFISLNIFSVNVYPVDKYISAKQVQYSPNQILVMFKPGTSPSAKAIAHGDNPPIAQYAFKNLNGLKMLTLPPGVDVETALASYRKNPNILYAEPDNIVSATATNDPSFTQLWGLDNTGQTINGVSGTADADMNVVEAWANSGVTGSNNVVIAVIDSGVQYNHPDLIDNMWVNPGEIAGNGIDDDSNGYIDDVYGINAITGSGDPMDDNKHGTHVAGTIAAVGENGLGITGVNQQAKILACKFLNAGGSGMDSDALKCLDYIYDLKMKGINIVVSNNSWGATGGGSQSVADAIEMQRNAGILFVAAAGNSSLNNDTSPHYPSNYFKSNLISVAATDQNDAQASFSNYGKRSVHVGAPGVNIYSSVIGSTFNYLQGTSMAAPHVAGLAALLSAQDPTRDWITIKNLILSSGTVTSSIANTTTTGRRVRAWDSDGTGAMTCSNQTVSSVIYPQTSSSTKIGGTKLGLSVLNINCEAAAGTITVTTTGPEAVGIVTMQDDGLEFDEVAGDGIYSAYWTAPASIGSYTLTFSNSQTQTVSVIANTSTLTSYRTPVEIAYSPRIDPNSSPFTALADNGYLYVNNYNAWYQILVGNVNTPIIYGLPAGLNMFVMPTAMQLTGGNTTLPNDLFETIIAGYWDDLDVLSAGYGIRAWAFYNPGATPEGEVIYEWKAKHKTTGLPIQFQIVYRSNSSDIEMHYITTDNNAESATVGIQVDWVRGSSQSVNQINPDLASGKAWKWSLDTGAPTANAGIDQNVIGNNLVTLSGTGTDPDNGVLNYGWVQTAGTSVTLTNSNSSSPTFYAPNVTEMLSFKLTVTDDSNQSATDLMDINVTAGSAAGLLQFSSVTYSVNENDTNVMITVTRTGGSSGVVGLSYATSDNTAFTASDYNDSSGTLSWSDGDASNKTFTVTITNDTAIESIETVNLTLLSPTGGVLLGTQNATLSIVDDDVPGTLGFSSASYSVNEDDVNATITVSRSNGSAGSVSLNYVTANGTADVGVDYAASSGTLTWVDGDVVDKTFTVVITDDLFVENSETVLISLSGQSGGASLGLSNATLTINDNDVPVVGSLSFSSAIYSVDENGVSIAVSVVRTGGSDGAVSIDYVTSDSSAIKNKDYLPATGTLSWADGDASDKSVVIQIFDDQVFEGDKSFWISLTSVIGGASIGTGSANVTIVENEIAVSGVLSIANSSVSVDEDGTTATITVTRSGAADGAVSVIFASADGSATVTEDYTTASGTLNWATGDSASKSIVVNILDDDIYEGNETFAVGLSGASGGATIGIADVIVTIVENEIAPSIPIPGTVSFMSSSFDTTEGDVTATITVQRIGGNDGAISVNYAITADTATLDSDFTTTSGTFSWPDGDATAKIFTVIILDDQLVEMDETINLSLSNLVGEATLGASDAILTIADDDGVPIVINQPPKAPVLISPANGITDINSSLVTFQWNKVIDPDGDAVTYLLEYCANPEFKKCGSTQNVKLEIQSTVLLAGMGGGAGIGIALFGIMGVTARNRRVLQVIVIIAASFFMTACGTNIPFPGQSGTVSEIVTNLKNETTYYWKVTAIDSNNLSTTSKIWTFTTR